MLDSLSRRDMLLGMGALGLGGLMRSGAALSIEPAPWLPGAVDEHWLHLVRMQKSTEPGDVPWWYTGRIYAQVGEQAPVHLFNLEGTEIYWVEPTPDGGFKASTRTLTFFRDRESGAMLREFKNPLTGKVNEVAPNKLGGKEAFVMSRAGWRFASAALSKPEPNPWHIEWHRSGDLVWLTSSRGSDGPIQPWLECMSTFCSAQQLMNPALPRLDAHFTSTYFSPWQRWLDMDDYPGHLIWHSTGRKLASIDEIPDEYRQRAEGEFGASLTARPDSFD